VLSLITLTAIIAIALILFIGGWLSVDLIGLLVLSAVVTVWAMFILSAGLTRTGVAHQLGVPLQRFV
jgi:hypothetical protein